MLKHARFDEGVTDGIMLVRHNTLIGYVAFEDGCITAMEVMPRFRRKGYGTRLMEFALDNGCDHLTVNPKNEDAIAFYESLGFNRTKKKLGINIEMKYKE